MVARDQEAAPRGRGGRRGEGRRSVAAISALKGPVGTHSNARYKAFGETPSWGHDLQRVYSWTTSRLGNALGVSTGDPNASRHLTTRLRELLGV